MKLSLDNPNWNKQLGFIIIGRILPSLGVFQQAAFQIELKLPPEYPFKAPDIRFLTKIYHPCVDDRGKLHKIA